VALPSGPEVMSSAVVTPPRIRRVEGVGVPGSRGLLRGQPGLEASAAAKVAWGDCHAALLQIGR
jgi:hypothetical protein